MRHEVQYRFHVGQRVEVRPGEGVHLGVVTAASFISLAGGSSTQGLCDNMGRDIIETPLYRVKLDDPAVAVKLPNEWGEDCLRETDAPMTNVAKGYKGTSHLDGEYYWDPLKGWVKADQPLVIHAGNPAFEKLRSDPEMEALRDRTVRVGLPHLGGPAK